LPRLNAQIKKHYPGTALAITEYNYGGGKHVSGMLAQADVLGLFGRYGVFAACNWGMGKGDIAQLAGFKAFIDYDGKGSRFLNRALEVKGEAPVLNSVFASTNLRPGNTITIVAINKTNATTSMRFATKGQEFANGVAFLRASQDFLLPKEQILNASNGKINFAAPPLSVTTLRLQLAR
jgi:hypothetical protein